MAPLYRVARSRNYKPCKQTLKYLAIGTNPRIQRMILKSASDSVYKSICNAFFNLAQNPDINLPLNHRKNLKRYNKTIKQIIDPQVKILKKRRIIQRGGGFFLAALLPTVLSTALSFLGSSFIKDK